MLIESLLSFGRCTSLVRQSVFIGRHSNIAYVRYIMCVV